VRAEEPSAPHVRTGGGGQTTDVAEVGAALELDRLDRLVRIDCGRREQHHDDDGTTCTSHPRVGCLNGRPRSDEDQAARARMPCSPTGPTVSACAANTSASRGNAPRAERHDSGYDVQSESWSRTVPPSR